MDKRARRVKRNQSDKKRVKEHSLEGAQLRFLIFAFHASHLRLFIIRNFTPRFDRSRIRCKRFKVTGGWKLPTGVQMTSVPRYVDQQRELCSFWPITLSLATRIASNVN